jgi:beta-glucosidase
MNRPKRAFLNLLCFFLAVSSLSILTSQEIPKYLDPAVPIEQGIDDLLPRMTVAEKVSQISDSWGSVAIPRLKVPSLLKTEGLHSQSYSTGATIFPMPIGMAATFDPALISKVGRQTAVESKAAHLRESWSPMLDVARDVRWGRVEETYGESPYVVGRMGVAWIEGFQSEGMIAVPKHFAGHGQPMGGRDSQDIGLSDRVMRTIHLPAFRAAVEEAHAGGIMAAYGVWDGVPDNASTTLLDTILRQEWGFDGMVVSDCGALQNMVTKQGIVRTLPEAAALGVDAGVNMNCGNVYADWAARALDEGLITAGQLDDAVRPVLRTKFRLGLFEHPEPDKMVWEKLPAYDTPEARALAREVSVEGQVLLKNDNGLLPLKKDLAAIAVIGPNADLAQTGDYSPTPAPGQLVTVLQAIRAHVPPATHVLFAPGLDTPISNDTSKFAEAVAAAKQANVAIVVVGDNSHPGAGEGTTGENRDGATLELPGAQRALIQAIQATGTPVVLVVVNGKPFTLEWEAENIPAILVSWYPGEEGGDATADLLFGDRDPSRRLPLTWPRNPAQLPLNYDYLPSGRRYDYYDLSFAPRWRFGYGLSYATFQYSNLRITPKDGDPGFVTVTADVRNTGSRDGDEVSQLYVTQMISSVVTPVIELEGVQRISLKAGETGTVHFELTPYQLSLLDVMMTRRVEPGQFRVHVGGVSPDVPGAITDQRQAKVGFSNPEAGISGEFTEPKEYSAQFTYTLEAEARAKNGVAFPATVTVRNNGNLTDVTQIKLYAGFELGSWSFELKPGEEKSHTFMPVMYRPGNLSVVAGSQIVSRAISLESAPPHLELNGLHMQVDEDSVLQVKAEARNTGSETYDGALTLKIDGKPSGESEPIRLQPGETRPVTLTNSFNLSGVYRVQVNDAPQQQITVLGGVRFSVPDPLLWIKQPGSGSVRNAIGGQELKIEGTPAWASGRTGQAIQLNTSGTAIEAGDLDLYRKSFTLSAWVNVAQLGTDGDLALFGSRAPMGADQDNSGTELSAGLHNGKLYMSLHGRQIEGRRDVPVGSWVNVTYTYDADSQQAELYLNGVPDRPASMAPYTGPLQTIGDAPELGHGSYSLDDAVVARTAFTREMVRRLYDKGIDSFRQGDFVSGWRAAKGSLSSLEAVAEIPEGDRMTVIVEMGDKTGKVLRSSQIELRPGTASHPLRGLQHASADATEQIRIRVQFSATLWGRSPFLRAVTLSGGDGLLHWTTAKNWSDGQLEPSLAVDTGESNLQ